MLQVLLQEKKDSETVKAFEIVGMPFIGGASGTIQQLSILMLAEELNKETIEAVLMLNTAILIAGGHHALGECLISAQIAGFFQKIPNPLLDYKEAASNWELYGMHFYSIGGPDLYMEEEHLA
jgi:hypothetical protein